MLLPSLIHPPLYYPHIYQIQANPFLQKAGAAIGTEVFTPIQDSFDDAQKGVQGVFLIGSAFALVGGIIAWTLIPNRDRELEGEDARFRAYLAEHGYAGTFGESLEEQVKTTQFSI